MPQIKVDGLTPAQVQVASALASGASISKAAALTQTGRTTIYTWIKTVPKFAAVVEALTIESTQTLRDKLHDFSAEAIDTVGAMMSHERASCSVRLRAALAILNRPTYPEKGWALPFPVGTPSEVHNRQVLNDLEADRRAMVIESQISKMVVEAAIAEAAAPSPAEQNGTVRNTSEQETEPAAPAIPRSAPCPCGSGEKYKRCCGRAAPPVLSRAA
jgi:hypothetical protein